MLRGGRPLNARHKRFWEFQRYLATLDLVECPEQAAVAAVGNQGLEHKSIDRLAAYGHGDHGELRDAGADLRRLC